MKQYLYIFILNNFVLFPLSVKLVNRTHPKLMTSLLVLICVLVFSSTYQISQMKQFYNSNLILTGEDKRIDLDQLQLKSLEHLDSNKLTSYFMIFNVPRQFDNQQLKQSYKQLIKPLHPDQGGDQDTFIAIRKIYQTLQSEQKRYWYDRYGSDIQTDDEHKGFQIVKIGECSMLYFVSLIFSIMFTYQSGQLLTRVMLLIFNLTFLYIEIQYYLSSELSMQPDLLDMIVPNLLVFQRVHLLRMMISPLILTVRLIQTRYSPSIESLISRLGCQNDYHVINALQKQIVQQLQCQLDSQQKQIKKQQEKGSWLGWIWKMVKVVAAFVIVFGVATHYIDTVNLDDE